MSKPNILAKLALIILIIIVLMSDCTGVADTTSNSPPLVSSEATEGVPKTTSVASESVPKTTSVASEGIPKTTSVASEGIPKTTSVASEGIPKTTSVTSEGIPKTTSVASEVVDTVTTNSVKQIQPTTEPSTVRDILKESTECGTKCGTEYASEYTSEIALSNYLYGQCNKDTIITLKNGECFKLYKNQQIKIAQLGDPLHIFWYEKIATVESVYINIYPIDYTPDFTKGSWAGIISR